MSSPTKRTADELLADEPERKTSRKTISCDFFDKPADELAPALLGLLLVRKLDDDTIVSGYIVDAECYPGGDDEASHSHAGKRTGHNAAMYGEPGSLYVHNTFGGNTSLYVTSEGPNEGAVVLIRALQPQSGLERMRQLRSRKRDDGGEGLAEEDLCSGPAKLTQSLAISRSEMNKQRLLDNDKIWLEVGLDVGSDDVVIGHRIGMESHGEWAEKQWRYHLRDNPHVSVVDKAGFNKVAKPNKTVVDPGNGPKAKAAVVPGVPRRAKGAELVAPHRLGDDFFDQPCTQLATELLGKVLVKCLSDESLIKGRIVEAEAFPGGDDEASHSHGGKKTGRNAALYMPPGTVYIHNTFGGNTSMYIDSQGEGAAVLLRSLEPVEGIEAMRQGRSMKTAGDGSALALTDLCSGPAKLTQAFSLKHGDANKKDLTVCDYLWLEDDESEDDSPHDVVAATRVGVKGNMAKEKWRFYIKGNLHVSQVDKAAEKA